MPKARNPKADEALKLYREGLKLIEISKQLDVPEGTVRRWKHDHKWDGERTEEKKPNARKKKRGAPMGNKNAVGGNQSAPKGNTNAMKYGFFRKYLPEETMSIIDEMPKDPLDILWSQIEVAYAAIIRAQQIMYVRDRNDKTVEVISESEEGTAYSYQQAWEKQANFLQAQARAQKTLESMINKYDAMLNTRRDLATEEQIARIEQMRANTEKIKGGEQITTEDKVAKLFDAIGGALDAE